MKEADIIAALEAGAKKPAAVADEVGASRSNTSRYMKQYAEDPESPVTRHPNPSGNGYIYGVEAVSDAGGAADMPVLGDREYSWEQYVPDVDEAGYEQADAELDEMESLIANRHETGVLPRFRLKGPPGTGKTTLASTIAATRGWPVFEVQVTAGMRESDLLGSPHLIGGDSVWVDGPFVKAALCSQVRPTVVVLDEINRAPFHRKSVVQSFLDHRAQVTLDLRGGEMISGEGQDLISIATMNEGPEYETFSMDPAEERRHGFTWEIPYLGMVDPEGEADLIGSSTPADERLARVYVKAANAIRRLAEDETSPVEKGIPTSDLLDWARGTASFELSGFSSPVARAARRRVIDPRYTGTEADIVESELLDVVREHTTPGQRATATSD